MSRQKFGRFTSARDERIADILGSYSSNWLVDEAHTIKSISEALIEPITEVIGVDSNGNFLNLSGKSSIDSDKVIYTKLHKILLNEDFCKDYGIIAQLSGGYKFYFKPDSADKDDDFENYLKSLNPEQVAIDIAAAAKYVNISKNSDIEGLMSAVHQFGSIEQLSAHVVTGYLYGTKNQDELSFNDSLVSRILNILGSESSYSGGFHDLIGYRCELYDRNTRTFSNEQARFMTRDGHYVNLLFPYNLKQVVHDALPLPKVKMNGVVLGVYNPQKISSVKR